MKAWLMMLPLAACAACAHAPRSADVGALFKDDGFAAPSVAFDRVDVFRLSPSMHAFLDTEVAEQARLHGPRRGLMNALQQHIQIEYDATRTRTAAETFDARTGNCLSLVLLTGALAREMRILVTYQQVHAVDTWSRTAGAVFRSTHVNVVLGVPPWTRRWGRDDGSESLVVDFLPSDVAWRLGAWKIADHTIVAMYWNNRAAEAMVTGESLDDAYWMARTSIVADPAFVAAYNTLGVIYRRHGDLAWAARAFKYALAVQPDSIEALTNLARVLDAMGLVSEAESARARLAEIQPRQPFYLLDQGMALLEGGDAEAALQLFSSELKRMPYQDEVHFAMAVANLRLGRVDRARRHLRMALEYSTRRDVHDLYAAKLAHLEQLRGR